MNEEFWTRQQSADHLSIHIRTLDKWATERSIPSYRFGRSVRYKSTDIIAEAEKCRV